MKIVVIGGTGLIGSKMVQALTEQGHEAVAAAPSTGVNAVTGEGLSDVLVGGWDTEATSEDRRRNMRSEDRPFNPRFRGARRRASPREP